jgi:prevent-host-death family protein
MLEVPLHEAEGHLADLIARAEAGEEVVITRDGRRVARIDPAPTRAEPPMLEDLAAIRGRLLDELVAQARLTRLPGPDAARAADFLYDENGLPG